MPERFFALIQSSRHLGLTPLLNSYVKNAGLFHPHAPDMRNALKIFFRRLDSRPEYLDWAADMAITRLFDLDLAEKYSEAAARMNPDDGWAEIMAASFRGDQVELARLIDDSDLTLPRRLDACDRLERMGAPQQTMAKKYDGLMRRYPNQWLPVKKYVLILRANNRRKQAVALERAWIERKNYKSDFDLWLAAASLAEDLNADGEHEEALKVIEPFIGSWQGAVLREYALTLRDLDRDAEAERAFRMAINRYPMTTQTRLDYIEFLWNHGRDDEAASNFVPVVVNGDAILDAGERFAKVFRDRPVDARKAFLALCSARLAPEALFRFLLRPIKRGAAFAPDLVDLLPGAETGKVGYKLYKYEAIKNSRGEAEAMAYLRGALAPAQLLEAGTLAIDNENFDLLWTLIQDPGSSLEGESLWALRAVGVTLNGGSQEQKITLLRHYQRPINGDRYIAYGKYIMGLCSREDVLAFTKDQNHALGEAAYYVAVRAVADGDFTEANRWFQLSIETADFGNRELFWGENDLQAWVANPLSLRLRKEFMTPEEKAKLLQ